MSRSILRRNKLDQTEMGEEPKNEEPFLKIETIWSETEENFEKITIKEENISDWDGENLFPEQPDDNYDYLSFSNTGYCDTQTSDGRVENTEEKEKIVEKEKDKKKRGKIMYESNDPVDTCQHDSKNFKVLKKRLRCGDCKSTLCPECYSIINSSVQTHFSKSDNNNCNLYPCKLCSMIFRSNCALQAHIRIHLLDTPYVCPDCGAIYNNIYFLSLHLINKCYHVYKVITNGCKFCLSKSIPPEDYLTHIELCHIKPVYKCSGCGTVFENTKDINRHLTTVHKNEKVTALSYFCCTMCGNLIISKSLYSKHLKYHKDHSAAFQIAYLCPCGQSFNSANSFRVHFNNCCKKGILPPQWTYLQVTLKTHEMLQIQNTVHNPAMLQTQSSLMCNSTESNNEGGSVREKLDYNFYEDGGSSEDLEDQQSEVTYKNDVNEREADKTKLIRKNMGEELEHGSIEKINVVASEKSLTPLMNNTEKMDIDIAKDGTELDVTVKLQSKSLTETIDNKIEYAQNCALHLALSSKEGDSDVIKETAADSIDMITEKLCLVPNVQLVEEFSQESAEENNLPENIENTTTSSDRVDNGDKNLKLKYDHIPCDHLGYLKRQQFSETRDKYMKKDTVRNYEFDDIAQNSDSEKYFITSVLDEKTGLMKTKKIIIQKTPIENIDSDISNVAPDVSETPEMHHMPNIHCREIIRPKNSTFFCCPFCSVLFPKHFSSFQRFRLHLECYHPEAGLDITVNRTEIPKSQTQFTSISFADDFDSDDDLCDLDDIDLQTRLNNYLKRSNKERKSVIKNIAKSNATCTREQMAENCEKGKKEISATENGNNNVLSNKSKELERKLRNEDAKDSETLQRAQAKNEFKLFSICKKNSVNRKGNENCKSLIRSSLNSNVIHCKAINSRSESFMNHESKQNRKTSLRKEQDVNFGYSKTKEKESVNNDFERNGEFSEAKDGEGCSFNCNRGKRTKAGMGDENDVSVSVETSGISKYRNSGTLLKKQFNLMSNRNRQTSSAEQRSLNDKREADAYENEELVEQGNLNNKICRVKGLSGKEQYYKNVSNSSRMRNEEFTDQDSQDNDFEKAESNPSARDDMSSVRKRSTDQRNSKRESDVWSEFYKTLKIAETLKKTNIKNKESPAGNKAASILKNYTNKRVVKKPKRYRESSDSDYSTEDVKTSAGEARNFASQVGTSGNDAEDEELYLKKRKLLRRLENVDHRVVDYIFDLIDGKEKNCSLIKKNSDSSVKCCKKRIVNGLKVFGKQSKVNVNTENEEDASLDYLNNGGEKELSDQNCDEPDWDVRNSCDEKSCDRRRGRPKKSEPLMLRERRRSDFDREANFIEKNFEADESDFFTNKRKRKLSSKLQYYKKMSQAQAEKNDFSSGQVITNKGSDTEKKLSCAICKDSYQNEADFRGHIQVHRVDENSHQCMECGECFVVRPSLEKHLHAFHKIKDIQKYIEENECSVPEKSEEADPEPLKENQCKVCKDEFASAHDLNKHFRIHGMAFLRQFRKENKSN